MTLAFPNPSRSFDKARNAVRFTGYDGMFEVPFFVDVGVLAMSDNELCKAEASETSFLAAFDALRTSIHAAAHKVYSKGSHTSYMLTVAEFR
ncbi:DUF1488 family protein [Ancylobacter defluvii]|uniref:DUF1488 domain-containing protein n=1 Tax=Ancylobacter defluvii TaxID=1282440 RepID=A0A9W6JXQ9_9HYPH|nr:DUF1488 domain-containing protein [Ancylobacter defluvii]MBS7586067.1 DUF1488 domain-containing protein [Ancylobacter defluvii]GLK84453.1 hypothetical protein GCM10017653_25230 [Ancylobacter defluvii]